MGTHGQANLRYETPSKGSPGQSPLTGRQYGLMMRREAGVGMHPRRQYAEGQTQEKRLSQEALSLSGTGVEIPQTQQRLGLVGSPVTGPGRNTLQERTVTSDGRIKIWEATVLGEDVDATGSR